jgi:hypothetical protein
MERATYDYDRAAMNAPILFGEKPSAPFIAVS